MSGHAATSTRAGRAHAARARPGVVIAALLIMTGCEKHEFEPPSRAAQVAQADSLYSPSMFDTVTWQGDSLRTAIGNDVFAARCRRCHDYLGGGGPRVIRGDTVQVPSLVEPDWSYANDMEAVRRRIFTGHPDGMPTWGVAGLSAREIDAVAYYIDTVLRPEAAAAR